MIGKLCVLGLALVVIKLDTAYSQVTLSTVLSWNTISFAYPSAAQEVADRNSGLYDELLTAPIDVDAEVKGGIIQRYFLTFPRFMGASPATLGYVRNVGKNVKVIPYPNWEANKPVCGKSNLISVYRVQYQPECNRLWVLDTGIFGDSLRCPPKVIAYDLNTNEVAHVFEIPEELYESRSILVTINVETLSCSNTFVYVADCQAYSIIVIDIKNKRAWRAIDKTMYPSPECGTIKIQREQFELMDGVLGMALKKESSGYNKLFYYPLSSGRMHYVYTHHLRNESMFLVPQSFPEIFKSYKTVRPSQSAALAIDSNGVSYSGLVEESSLVCWNTQSADYGRYTEEFYRDQTALQFPTGVKMIRDERGEHVFVVTPRLQKVILGSLDRTDINFRVSAVSTRFIYQNTMCNQANGAGTYYYSSSPCDVCDSKKYRLSGYPYYS